MIIVNNGEEEGRIKPIIPAHILLGYWTETGVYTFEKAIEVIRSSNIYDKDIIITNPEEMKDLFDSECDDLE